MDADSNFPLMRRLARPGYGERMTVESVPPPIFARLTLPLHLLIVALVGFIIVWERLYSDNLAIVLALVFLGVYILGAIGRQLLDHAQPGLTYAWLTALTVVALALVWTSPNTAYLVAPLFFLYLQHIPHWWGVAAVAACTLLTILILAMADRLTIGGVIGPLLGAFVVVTIGLGYRALYWENRERQQLITELLATRQELMRKEHEAGVLAERARLAREIHDTVAQGLSSIQLLLHAAERADGDRPGGEHVRLARATAAASLEETRRIIQELTPAYLEQHTLIGALDRLTQSVRQPGAGQLPGERGPGLTVTFRTSGEVVPLPMNIETALLRIAQSALANVVQHADATRATMTLTFMGDSVSLDVVDDGRGFDPAAAPVRADSGSRTSFGLTAMRQRVAQLGGDITIESAPGAGAALAVTFGLER